MRVLITGGTGFLGTRLARRLAAEGHSVHVTRSGSRAIEPGLLPDGVSVSPLDVTDSVATERVVGAAKPERIYHFAAQSFPKLSWERPAQTMAVNAVGTVHLFEAAKKLRPLPRVVVACSSSEYGGTIDGSLLSETAPLLPVSPYGVSKVAQDLLAYQYFRTDGVPAIRARIFNTIGPGKKGDAPSEFVSRAVQSERGGGGEIVVGNLDSRRDFTDVRDTVRALDLLMERGRPGDAYNVSSGKAVRVGEVLDAILRLSRAKISYRQDANLLRPNDEPLVVGDNAKILRDVGWRPEIPLDKTIGDMMEYERGRTDGT